MATLACGVVEGGIGQKLDSKFTAWCWTPFRLQEIRWNQRQCERLTRARIPHNLANGQASERGTCSRRNSVAEASASRFSAHSIYTYVLKNARDGMLCATGRTNKHWVALFKCINAGTCIHVYKKLLRALRSRKENRKNKQYIQGY